MSEKCDLIKALEATVACKGRELEAMCAEVKGTNAQLKAAEVYAAERDRKIIILRGELRITDSRLSAASADAQTAHNGLDRARAELKELRDIKARGDFKKTTAEVTMAKRGEEIARLTNKLGSQREQNREHLARIHREVGVKEGESVILCIRTLKKRAESATFKVVAWSPNDECDGSCVIAEGWKKSAGKLKADLFAANNEIETLKFKLNPMYVAREMPDNFCPACGAKKGVQ